MPKFTNFFSNSALQRIKTSVELMYVLKIKSNGGFKMKEMIGIVYSPGFGAGWSTWVHGNKH